MEDSLLLKIACCTGIIGMFLLYLLYTFIPPVMYSVEDLSNLAENTHVVVRGTIIDIWENENVAQFTIEGCVVAQEKGVLFKQGNETFKNTGVKEYVFEGSWYKEQLIIEEMKASN
jgi:hypothetical protein